LAYREARRLHIHRVGYLVQPRPRAADAASKVMREVHGEYAAVSLEDGTEREGQLAYAARAQARPLRWLRRRDSSTMRNDLGRVRAELAGAGAWLRGKAPTE
jgi:hypothetical protein